VVGQRPVHGRVQARYTGIKVTALVMVKVTGTKKHFMRVPHNWGRKKTGKLFWVIFSIEFVGKIPGKNCHFSRFKIDHSPSNLSSFLSFFQNICNEMGKICNDFYIFHKIFNDNVLICLRRVFEIFVA